MVWGGIHGFYQVIGDMLKPCKDKLINRTRVKTDCFSWRILEMAATFCMVSFAWVFFRADTITDALRYIKRILVKPTPWLMFNGGIYSLGIDRAEMTILVFAVLILVFVEYIKYKKGLTLDVFLFSQNIWFEWVIVIGLLLMIFIYGEYGPLFNAKQFIYFQF